MKKIKFSFLIGFAIILVAGFVYFLINQESSFLRRPRAESFSIIIIINKSSGGEKCDQFINSMRSFAANPVEQRVTEDSYFEKSESSKYIFLRINKKNISNFDEVSLEDAIERRVKLNEINGYVEYAFLNDQGDLTSTGSFKPNLLP